MSYILLMLTVAPTIKTFLAHELSCGPSKSNLFYPDMSHDHFLQVMIQAIRPMTSNQEKPWWKVSEP